MVENKFVDDQLAGLYDLFDPPQGRPDCAFYLPRIMQATSVLDVGCGTGALLRMARAAGHDGRLCGLDPAEGMLNQARRDPSIEWVVGTLLTIDWEREFDLVVMTGHAFQEMTEDAEIRRALVAVRTALTDSGQFAFETRNPLDRAWERWPANYSGEVIDATRAVVRCVYEVETPVTGNIVRTRSTFTSTNWPSPASSHGNLRFIDAATLAAFLADAGLVIDVQYGDWSGVPLTDASPEIITIVSADPHVVADPVLAMRREAPA